MADFSHSMQRTQASATLSKKISLNGNGITAKTVYDDVFGGPPKFGVPTFSSRIDDYNEIFGSFNCSRVSSIPILDLPIVDESDVSIDVRNSKFNYSEVFGGFNGLDFAVSYEELLAEPKGGESSSDDVWTSAETDSPSEGSSEDPTCSQNNQAFLNEESYQSLDGTKQFNMLYQKTNQISNEDGISATTHIAQLNSVPAFTFIVDAERDKISQMTKLCSVDADFCGQIMEETHLKETMLDEPVCHNVPQISESDLKHKESHLKEAMSDQPVCQQISESNLKHKKCHLKEAMSDQPICQQIFESDVKRERKHFKETMPDKPVCQSVTQISESDLIHQSNPGGNGSYRSKAFVTVSEINLKTVPSHVPPPSRPPPKVSIKRTASDGSPPYFDVEVDASSSAAAAAMKEVMEKAQARLKSAKESMERKRDGLQNRKKLGLKDDITAKERREGETTNEAHRLKEKAHGTFLREDNEIKGFALEERHKATTEVQVAPDFQVAGKLANSSTELIKQKHGEESVSTQESNEREDGTGEWKVEEQYFELVKADKLTANMEDPKLKEQWQNKSNAMELNLAQEVCYRKEDENKFTVEIEREEHVKKEKVSPEREEHEKKLQEYFKRLEHEKQLKQASEQEEYEMKVKKILEQEENEKKQREVREREENEKREKMASERNEKEKRLKEACEQEENEKRQKEAHEREENAKRLIATHELEKSEKRREAARDRERMENEKRLKEVEREENEKRLNEAREREENEKRQEEAREREENEKRLARARKENEKRLAREREENEKRLAHEREESEKRIKEAREREENEKRLKEAHEKEKNEKRLEEAREKEEIEKRLKEARERDEIEKRLKEAREWEENQMTQQECKREENDKKLKAAQEALVCREEGKNLKKSKESLESAKSENKLKVANDMCKQDADKKFNATREASKQELDTDKFELAQISREPEESGKTMETATCASEHKENGRELKAAKRVLNEQDGICRLEVEHADRSAPEHEDLENKRKIASDAKSQDNKKDLVQPQASVSQEKNERNEKPYQGALEREENKNKYKGAQGKRELVENGKKMEAAHHTNMVEQKGEKLKIGTAVIISQDTERKEKILSESLPMEEREKEGRMQREREREKERLRKLEEEREREREREKDRMAVERATREARDRAFADARERAERAAVERATAEARQRAMAEARERLEKASAEAREKSLAEKASMEARLKAERAAVERATAEARERAVEKARAEKTAFGTRERAERTFSEKFSTTSRDGGMRHSSSFSDLRDSQFQSSSSSSNFQRYSNSSNHAASYASEKFPGAEIESAQRCKARLERHQRTVERAAKALAEKNMRDLLAQREQSERNRFAETLDTEVKRWSSGKEGNLRALLSTLQYILGPHSGWQPIPLTEVITAVAVKKAYRKATLCVHPDKLQQRGATIQQKYICEKVFDLLKEAWNKFNSEER